MVWADIYHAFVQADDVMKKPIITLLTDFGLTDEYVGVMKGVIFSVNRNVDIVDITHHIPRHDVQQAALMLKSAFSFFPAGSIHVAVVDPGVGSRRDILCLKHDGHFFLAPDNGILTHIVQESPPEAIYAVRNKAFFLETVSHTFNGRDILAPVAAHLSRGVDISELGESRAPGNIHLLDVSAPHFSPDGRLSGEIISIDRFGNLITNIDRRKFCRFCKLFCETEGHTGGADVVVTFAGIRILGVSTSYTDTAKGTPLAIFGSRNLLEISINQGNAGTYFNTQVGQRVTVMQGRSGGDCCG